MPSIETPWGTVGGGSVIRVNENNDLELLRAYLSENTILFFTVDPADAQQYGAGFFLAVGNFSYNNRSVTGKVEEIYGGALWIEGKARNPSQGSSTLLPETFLAGTIAFNKSIDRDIDGAEELFELIPSYGGDQDATGWGFRTLSRVPRSGREESAALDIRKQYSDVLGTDVVEQAFSPISEWMKDPDSFDIYAINTYTGGEDPPVDDVSYVLSESFDGTNKPDPITNFDPKSQKIRIDSDPFGISGDYEVDFRIAKSSKQLKKLQKSDFNLIYNRKDGSLYYNVNREEAGFGDRGGLIAVLDPKLPLTAANFEIF